MVTTACAFIITELGVVTTACEFIITELGVVTTACAFIMTELCVVTTACALPEPLLLKKYLLIFHPTSSERKSLKLSIFVIMNADKC
ncbi:MAG: hypothetical protein ACYTXY_11810 [Nostoc sp.]